MELLEPLIPAAKPGGRPREVEIGTSSTPYFTEGCRWRSLPGDSQHGKQSTYFRNWRIDGTWVSIHDRLRVGARRTTSARQVPQK